MAATLATLSSNRRMLGRGLDTPSECKSRSALLANTSPCNSWAPSTTGSRRGVLRPLNEKSSRMSRTESLLNCSRQKGQTGARRGGVFSTMVEQHVAHRTCPRVKKINFRQHLNRGRTHRKKCSEEDDEHCIPQRKRRKSSRDEGLALDQPVESTSRSEAERRKGKKVGRRGKREPEMMDK